MTTRGVGKTRSDSSEYLPRRVFLSARRRWLLLLTAVAILLWVRVWWGRSAQPATRPAFTSSLRALQTACNHRPDDAAAFVALGRRLELLGADRPAYGAFARAAALAPQDEAAREGWARMAGELLSPRRAVAILSPFVLAHPADAGAHLALAESYQRVAARRLAYDEAVVATRLDPADPAAPRVMATAAIALEHYSQAEAALRRVLALDPADWRSVLDLGFVLDHLSRQPEAMACYGQASRIAPGAAEPLRLYGQALLQKADTPQILAEAGRCLAQAASLDPKDVLTYVLLAQIAARNGDWRGAHAQMSVADRLPPAASSVQLVQTYLAAQIARHFADSARMRRALARHADLVAYGTRKALLFDHIVAHPTDLAARLALARACAAHGDIPEAVAAYRRLLTFAPDGPVAQELAAIQQRLPMTSSLASPALSLPLPLLLEDAATLAAEGQDEAASDAYGKALALDPNSAPALLGTAVCLEHQGKTDLAFAFFDQAFGHGAQDPPGELDVAARFEANGFHDSARVRLERLVAHDPGSAPAWHLLGSVCSQGARYSRESRESFVHASALTPQNVPYLLDAADADADAGQTAAAEAKYRRAVALAPTDADALSRLAGFLVSSRRDQHAAADADGLLARALAAQPDNEFAWYQRGLLALDRGRPQEAVTNLRRSVALAPTVAQAWYALARALQRVGDAPEAARAAARSQWLQQDYLERARLEEQVHSAPGELALRLQLARAYGASGENARAIEEYRICLRRNPALGPARQELAALQGRLRAAGHLPSALVFRYMLAQQQS